MILHQISVAKVEETSVSNVLSKRAYDKSQTVYLPNKETILLLQELQP
jgi:hypothetical protein